MWILVLRSLGVLNLLFLDSLGLDVFCLLILFGRWFRDETSPPKTNHSAARCAVCPSIRRDPLFFLERMKQNGSKSSQVRGSNRKEPLDSREVCCLDLDLGAADDDDSWLTDCNSRKPYGKKG